LIPVWTTRTPLQFGPASSILFLSLPGQLTWLTFTLSAYLNLAQKAYLILTQMPYPSLIRLHQCLSGLICSYPAESPHPILLLIGLLLTGPYTVLPDRTTLPDPFPIGLLPTRSYPTTLPNFLTRPGYPPMHIPSTVHYHVTFCGVTHIRTLDFRIVLKYRLRPPDRPKTQQGIHTRGYSEAR
jgi:hypothetical protein